MKITIEHDVFTATTSSLFVAERLIETIRCLQGEQKRNILKELDVYQNIDEVPKPKRVIVLTKQKQEKESDIFDTEDTSDVPEEVIKSKLPKFKPAWIEKPIDLKTQRIVRYSNPCSTLHGKCGSKCWQTELWVDTNGTMETCDCEFYEIDELKNILDTYIKEAARKSVIKPRKTHAHCSMRKLNQVAELFNRGCDNKQVSELLKISLASVSAYKSDCRRHGLLK